jgi:hypothetical protein
MLRPSLALSLLATSALAARNSSQHNGETVQGAYIVEFEDGSVVLTHSYIMRTF